MAQLSLKHRQNKNQRQRIIVFVGSPVGEEEAALVRRDPHPTRSLVQRTLSSPLPSTLSAPDPPDTWTEAPTDGGSYR